MQLFLKSQQMEESLIHFNWLQFFFRNPETFYLMCLCFRLIIRFTRLVGCSFDKQKQIAEKNEELIYCG